MTQQEFPPGHEAEGKVEDARSVLSQWYGDNAIYVDTIENKRERQGKKSGIGRLMATNDRTDRREPLCIDRVYIKSETEVIGILKVTDDHTLGHFKKDSGLPMVFPGHKRIRAAVEAVREAERLRSNNSKTGAVLWGFDRVEFNKIIKPGNLLEINIKEIERRHDVTWQDVEIKRESDVVASIKNMVVELTDGREGENPLFLEDQLIESAAQTAGLIYSSFEEGDSMPLFQSIGGTRFFKRANTGDDISMHTEVSTGIQGEFEAFVVFKANGGMIGQINKLRAKAVPLNVARHIMRG